MAFEGFSRKTLEFLLENRLNDSRSWYQEHRESYRADVYGKFVRLAEQMAPGLLALDGALTVKPASVISRIHRDTRFSRDKTLYRDNVWIAWLRDKTQMASNPCYWFELGQSGWSYGLGYYSADAKSMAAMRTLILAGDPDFAQAERAYKEQVLFTIGGETYKRTPCPDAVEERRLWLDRKNIFFERAETDYEAAFSPALPDTLLAGYRTLYPIYRFLLKVEERKRLL